MKKYLERGTTEEHRESLVGERGDPIHEHAYWCAHYAVRPYVDWASYEVFDPAYAYGVSSYRAHADHGHSFEDIEGDMERDWDQAKGTSKPTWERAKHAVMDAWQRLTR